MRQAVKAGEALVLNIDVGQEVQAEMKLLEAEECVEMRQRIVGVALAACPFVPHGSWKEQFLQAPQPGEVVKILGYHERSRKVDAHDLEISWREIFELPDGFGAPLRRDAPPQADDPLRHSPLAFLCPGRRRHGRQGQHQSRNKNPSAAPAWHIAPF